KFAIAETGGWAAVLKYNLSSAIDYLTGLGFVRCFFGSILDLPSHSSISTTMFSPMLTAFMMIFCWLFTACWVVGWWRTRSKPQLIVGCLVGAYLLQLCIYPANLSERALYVVLPFILIWAWKGFVLALDRWPRMQLLRPAMLVLAGYCIVVNALGFGPAANYLNGCGRHEELVEV